MIVLNSAYDRVRSLRGFLLPLLGWAVLIAMLALSGPVRRGAAPDASTTTIRLGGR